MDLLPESVADFTFGGPKRNHLFITAGTSLYALRVTVNGVQYPKGAANLLGAGGVDQVASILERLKASAAGVLFLVVPMALGPLIATAAGEPAALIRGAR